MKITPREKGETRWGERRMKDGNFDLDICGEKLKQTQSIKIIGVILTVIISDAY